MTYILIIAALIVAALIIYLRITYRGLSGEDLRQYDRMISPHGTAVQSEALDTLNAYLDEEFGRPAVSGASKSGWNAKRKRFDAAGLARTDLQAEFRSEVITIDGREITASWTLLDGYDPGKRILYIHGGGFTVGSDISHRALTTSLAKRTGASVFALNYRLMPEHKRSAGIEDARAAYDWIIENGPDGAAPTRTLALAGDSAGGNLVLMLSNWARNSSRKRANAVLALSPITDSTFSAPSIKANLDKDRMLRPLIAPLTKIPRIVLLLFVKKLYGYAPTHPDISPIYDDLSGLPPTYLLASQDETIHDDSARYAAKMRANGSPVTFHSWSGGLPHVWPIFDNAILEANAALDDIGTFLNQHI